MAVLPAAIPSPSTNVVDVGPFTVHIYGLCYVLAVVAAVAITRRRWGARGGSPELVYDVALWGVPAGIVGGRLYFLATTPGDAFEHWWGPFAVWEGGLGIWGGIALGTIVGLWRVRRAGASLADFLDAAAPALLVAQAIGRIGNYFNQELFGRPDRPAVGARDRPRPSARALRRRCDVPPDVPLRAAVEPRARQCAGLARPPPQHPAAGPVRALRRRLLRLPYRRRAAPRRSGRASPRAALEPAAGDRRHGDRRGVVRRDAAPTPTSRRSASSAVTSSSSASELRRREKPVSLTLTRTAPVPCLHGAN